jgi:hypothetical protein
MLLAGAAGVMLLLMVVTAVITGATQERHEHFMPSAEYATSLLANAKGLRVLMGLDVAFCILYTLFFATLAMYLRSLDAPRVFLYLGVGAMLLTCLLDMVEDHHILSLLEAAEHGVMPADDSIAWQATESSVKFSVSYFSLVAFGLAIPRTTKLGYVLCLFLTVGTLLTAVIFYAAPPEFQASLESGRWIGFLAGFLLAIAWLRQQRDT